MKRTTALYFETIFFIIRTVVRMSVFKTAGGVNNYKVKIFDNIYVVLVTRVIIMKLVSHLLLKSIK